MANPVNDLPPWDSDSGLLNVIMDTPRRSRNKYKFDPKRGVWRLGKVLPLGASFPFDFGFLPGTKGDGGDPIDVLVLMDEPAFVGCVVPARLIGVLEAEQTEEGKTIRNDRLVAVLETPYNPPPFRSLDEVGSQRLAEIEHFFISYNEMEGRQFKPVGRKDPARAQELVEQALDSTGSRERCGEDTWPRQKISRPCVAPPRLPERSHTMSFQLKSGKPLRKAIKRLAKTQIDDALQQVAGESGNSRDEAVHEARKGFKKVRAILRLVQPPIGETTFQRENICFRDAGRPLTEVRDAKVLVQTLDDLLGHFAEHVRGRSFGEVRKELVVHQKAVQKRVLDEQNAFATVTALVQQALQRFDDWTDVPNRWSAIGEGLEQVYRQGRQTFAEAETEPSVENLHEWRKQVKYLRYQLEILRPLWPELIEDLAGQADHLGDLSGTTTIWRCCASFSLTTPTDSQTRRRGRFCWRSSTGAGRNYSRRRNCLDEGFTRSDRRTSHAG